MKEQVEIELKTLVSKDQFEKLCSFYEPLEFVEQINTYFITDDMKHYAFRIRERKGEKLFTLKQKVNGLTVEHEKVFTGNFFSPTVFILIHIHLTISPLGEYCNNSSNK